MEQELQLLSTVDDPTRRLEDELLDTAGFEAWPLEEEEEDEAKQQGRRRRRLEQELQMMLSTVDDPTRGLEDELFDTAGFEDELEDEARQQAGRRRRFALAVRNRRFARYSLLIGGRYGVWSTADRRFVRKTDRYHYHHLTQGISDVKELYDDLFYDGFGDAPTMPRLLCRLLFVHPRRTARILAVMPLYYHTFMAKDRRMECCLDEDDDDDAYARHQRDQLTSLRHRLVDVYRRRMTPAERRRVLEAYEFDRFAMWFFFGFIVVVLFVIGAWFLY